MDLTAAAADRWWLFVMHATSTMSGPRRAFAALGFADRLHPLGHRVKRIMDPTVRRSTKLSLVGALVLCVFGSVALPGLHAVNAKKDAQVSEAGPHWIPSEFRYLYPYLEDGPYALYGTVTEPDGSQAAGIRVVAFRGEAWRWGVTETVTDEDGSYEIGGLPDGAYWLMAVDDAAFDFWPIRLGPPFLKGNRLQRDLKIEPFGSGSFTGRVQTKDGEPVEDAVIVSVAGWGSYGVSLALRIRTDSEGRYTIPEWNRPLMRPNLVAFANGHGPGVLREELSATTSNYIVLGDGVRVSGTLRHKASGDPAPDVPLVLRGTPADNDLPDIMTTSDVNGAFHFDRLPPFQFQLVVYDPEEGYTAHEHPRLRLYNGEDIENLDLMISEGATISGRVTAKETDEPLAGVRVWIPNVRHPVVLREAHTDTDGRYALRWMPGGEYTVRCDIPENVVKEYFDPEMGGSPRDQRISLEPDKQVSDVNFGFERGVSVSGRVTDELGNPVPGARLRASNLRSGRTSIHRRLTTSEAVTVADGSYRLWGFVPSGHWNYRMTVSAKGYGRLVSEPFPLVGDWPGMDFVLERAATIEGRVIGMGGEPARFVRVKLTPLTQNSERPAPEDVITDEEGCFAFNEGAYPGEYSLETGVPGKGFGPFVMNMKPAQNPPIRVDSFNDIRRIEVVVAGAGGEVSSKKEAKEPVTAEVNPAHASVSANSEGVVAIPVAEDVPGRIVFQGRYRHLSRSSERGVGLLWIKEHKDGAISALSNMPFFKEIALAVGDTNHRPVYYAASREAQGRYPAFEARLDFEEDKVAQVRHWGGEQDDKEYPIEPDTLFDLNSRPDPYAVVNILVRRFALEPGSSREFSMCDWGNGEHGQGTLPSYRVRVEHKGKERVTVPAGTFEANHLVLTQLTSADTWFKKRAGHVTDLWTLDNHVIVRILRHREPYELELLDYSVPDDLPGQMSGPGEGATGTLKIISALYGARDKWVNVTGQLERRIEENTLRVRASNALAGDPLDGVVKELRVHYQLGDSTYATTVREGDTLRLPSTRSVEDREGTPSGVQGDDDATSEGDDMTTAISGRVTDMDGVAIEGAELFARTWGGQPFNSGKATSDGEGRYRITDLLPRREYRVFAEADGYTAAYVTRRLGTGEVAGFDFSLEKGVYLSGRVLDTESRPLSGLTLELVPTTWSDTEKAPTRLPLGLGGVTTDDQGRFEAPHAAPGRYWVKVYQSVPSADRCWQQVALEGILVLEEGQRIEDHEVRVLPPDSHTISGTVVDGEGKPLPGVVVDSFIPHDRHWWTRTDEQGRFTLLSLNGIGRDPLDVYFNQTGLPAGGYKVVIRDVPIGTDDLKLVVHKPGAIKGVVFQGGGVNPLTDFGMTVHHVQLLDSAAVVSEAVVNVNRTGGRGAFHITNVPAGRAVIEIKVEERKQWHEVEVRPGDITEDVTVELLPPCVFEGTALFSARNGYTKPVGLEVVHIESKKGMGGIEPDESGNFRVDTLPAGEFAVRALYGGEAYLTKNVRLEHGKTIRERFDVGGTAEIRGVIRFPQEDYGFVKLILRETGLDFPPPMWGGRPAPTEYALVYNIARESGGEYGISWIPPGTWELAAMAYASERCVPLEKRPHAIQEVTLVEGQSLKLDLDLTLPIE